MITGGPSKVFIPEIAPPTVSIATPAMNAQLTNSQMTATGTAKDNRTVESVCYQLNSNPWSPAIGTTKWTANLMLTPGTNTLRVCALDSSGNRSSTNRVTFVYLQMAPLTLTTSGNGTVSLNKRIIRGQPWLQVGKEHALTATAGTGYAFVNWMNGVGTVLTNGTTLRFAMESNLALVANFIPNPLIPAAGNYSGLFYTTNGEGVTLSNSGSFTATVTGNGAFSAKLQQEAQSYSLAGQFALDGVWQTSSVKDAPGMSVALKLQLNGGDEITGQISNGSWTAELLASRAVYSKTNSVPYPGQYTLVIPGSHDPANLPGGHGATAVNVSAAGIVVVSGILGDGTAITRSTFLSKQGQFPLYAAPYAKKGIVIGWLTFTNDTTTASDLQGVLSWIKPGRLGTKLYPGGFDWPYDSETPNAFGSAFISKTPLLNWTNGAVILENGNLTLCITNGLMLSSAGEFKGANKLSGVITVSGVKAGLFKGSVIDPITKTAKTINGAILQRRNAAYGNFLGTNQM